MHTHVYIPACTYVRKHVCTQAAHIFAHICVHRSTHTRLHTRLQTFVQACARHFCTHMRRHVRRHTCGRMCATTNSDECHDQHRQTSAIADGMSTVRGIGVPVLRMTASARAFQRCVPRGYIVDSQAAMYICSQHSYGPTYIVMARLDEARHLLADELLLARDRQQLYAEAHGDRERDALPEPRVRPLYLELWPYI